MKNFICFGIKSDLTYYHGSLLPLKDFRYFPEKTLEHFPTSNPKSKKKPFPKIVFPKSFLHPRMNADQVKTILFLVILL